MKRIKMQNIVLLLCMGMNLHALTLDEAIQTALDNSVDMKKVSMNIEIAQEGLKEKKASKYGRFDAMASYTHYNLPRTLTPLTPASMASGSEKIPTTQDMMIAGVAYNVNLFTGMSDTRSIEIAELSKSMAKNIRFLSQEQLIYNVKTLYTNILAVNAQIKAQKQYVGALNKLHDTIKLREELGSAAHIDTLKSAAEVSRAQTNLQKLITNRDILKDTLATVMFVDAIEDKLTPINIEVQPLQEDRTHYNTTLKKSKKLVISQENIQKSIKQQQKSKAAFYPKIGFNAYYGQNMGVNDSSNPNSGDFKTAEVWQAGVDLKWNIFDFGKKSSLYQKSKIATMEAKLEDAKTKRELQHSLEEALQKIDLALSSYTSAQTELALMEETQKIEQIRYDNGASDINDLLYTKARYQIAKSGYINAKYEYQNACNYLNYILEQGNEK